MIHLHVYDLSVRRNSRNLEKRKRRQTKPRTTQNKRTSSQRSDSEVEDIGKGSFIYLC